MRVLVTGSSGSIGSAIAQRLREEEHDVLGLDLNPGKFTTALGDITDEAPVNALAKQVDAIVHTASLHAPHVASHTEEEFKNVNVRGTEVLLAAAEQHRLRRFVYTSTTSVYGHALVGEQAAVWVTEDLPPRPRDIYDRTKLSAEALCRQATLRGAVPCVVMRMSRCFPEPPALMACYRLHRGVDRRDVAQAHALALGAVGEGFAIYNVSASSPFAPEDCVELVRNAPAVLERRCPALLREFERRGWSPPRSIDRVYVINRAQTELGYRPQFGFREFLMEHDEAASTSNDG